MNLIVISGLEFFIGATIFVGTQEGGNDKPRVRPKCTARQTIRTAVNTMIYGCSAVKDVISVIVEPQKAHHREQLKYHIKNIFGDSLEAVLHGTELITHFKNGV